MPSGQQAPHQRFEIVEGKRLREDLDAGHLRHRLGALAELLGVGAADDDRQPTQLRVGPCRLKDVPARDVGPSSRRSTMSSSGSVARIGSIDGMASPSIRLAAKRSAARKSPINSRNSGLSLMTVTRRSPGRSLEGWSTVMLGLGYGWGQYRQAGIGRGARSDLRAQPRQLDDLVGCAPGRLDPVGRARQHGQRTTLQRLESRRPLSGREARLRQPGQLPTPDRPHLLQFEADAFVDVHQATAL